MVNILVVEDDVKLNQIVGFLILIPLSNHQNDYQN